MQASAVALAVPALFAALAAAATRGKGHGGSDAETAHGSARWATASDLRRANLFARQGVVLGRWSGPSGAQGAAARELLNTAEPEKLFAQLAEFAHDPDGSRFRWRDPLTGEKQVTHPEVARQARRFKATPERERGSLVSTLQPFLDLWGDPVVARSTETSDFSLDALLGSGAATLYASVPYHDLARIGGLMRILLTALFRRVTLRGADRNARRLEVLLDELASLGRVPVIEDTLAFLRGYGVRCTLAVQGAPGQSRRGRPTSLRDGSDGSIQNVVPLLRLWCTYNVREIMKLATMSESLSREGQLGRQGS